MFGMVRRPSRMSGSDWETLRDVWKWSGGRPGCPRVDVMHTRMSGSGRETLPYVREWSGEHPGFLEVVRRPSRSF